MVRDATLSIALSLRARHHWPTNVLYKRNADSLYLHKPFRSTLRLRVENQRGFKMVKRIQAIEFVEDISAVRGGGFAKDQEYVGELANI